MGFFSRFSPFNGAKVTKLTSQIEVLQKENKSFRSQLMMPMEEETGEDIIDRQWDKRRVVNPKYTMPGSGYGYVHEPYAAQIQLIWGNERPPDYEKYIQMYIWVPVIKRATDEQVNLSLGKPYTFEFSEAINKKLDKLDTAKADPKPEGEEKVVDNSLSTQLKEKILERVNEINERIELDKWKTVIGFDLLQLGNAFIENCFEDLDFYDTFAQYSTYPGLDDTINYYKDHENRKIEEVELWFWHETTHETKEKPSDMNDRYNTWKEQDGNPVETTDNYKVRKALTRGRLMNIQPLDPRFLRTRRDPLGVVHGFIQLLGFPPITFDNDQICHMKWQPKSWGMQSAYGTSHYQSQIRNQEMIWQVENDMTILSHNNVKQPGTYQVPQGVDWDVIDFSEKQARKVFGGINSREAGSDIFNYSPFRWEPVPSIQGAGETSMKFLDYLKYLRLVGTGVPPSVLGIESTGTQTTSRVNWNNFIVRLQNIQIVFAEYCKSGIFAVGLEQEIKYDITLYKKNKKAHPDEEADLTWGKEVLGLMKKLKIPYFKYITKGKTTKKILEFPLWLIPDFKWTEIGREDKDRQMQRASTGHGKSLMTLNEARKEIGYPEVPDGDKFIEHPEAMGSSGWPTFPETEKESASYAGMDYDAIHQNLLRKVAKDQGIDVNDML